MAASPKKSPGLDTDLFSEPRSSVASKTVIEGVAIIAFFFRALTTGDGEGQYLNFVQIAEVHGSKFSQ